MLSRRFPLSLSKSHYSESTFPDFCFCLSPNKDLGNSVFIIPLTAPEAGCSSTSNAHPIRVGGSFLAVEDANRHVISLLIRRHLRGMHACRPHVGTLHINLRLSGRSNLSPRRMLTLTFPTLQEPSLFIGFQALAFAYRRLEYHVCKEEFQGGITMSL